jgi:hypothetical protein
MLDKERIKLYEEALNSDGITSQEAAILREGLEEMKRQGNKTQNARVGKTPQGWLAREGQSSLDAVATMLNSLLFDVPSNAAKKGTADNILGKAAQWIADSKDRYEQQHPFASKIYDTMGTIGSFFVPMGTPLKAAGVASKTGRIAGALSKTLPRQLAAQGAVMGGGLGGLQAAASDQTLREGIKDTLIKGASGAAMGAGLGKLSQILSKSLKAKDFIGDLPRELVEKSVKEKIPLIELAQGDALGKANAYGLASSESRAVYEKFKERLGDEQAGRLAKVIEDNLGKGGSQSWYKNLAAQAKQQTQGLYDIVDKTSRKSVGELPSELLDTPVFGKISEDVLKQFGNAEKFLNADTLSVDSPRILNEVKKGLDKILYASAKQPEHIVKSQVEKARNITKDMINKATGGVYNKALTSAKKTIVPRQIIETMTGVNPEIEAALTQAAKEGSEVALTRRDAAQRATTNVSLDWLSKRRMSKNADTVEAVRKSLIDNALKKTQETYNKGELPNIARKVFNRPEYEKYKMFFDEKSMEGLKKGVKGIDQAVKNINVLTGGSSTARNLSDAGMTGAVRAMSRPKRWAMMLAANTIGKAAGLNPTLKSQSFIDPQVLEQLLKTGAGASAKAWERIAKIGNKYAMRKYMEDNY